MLNMSDVIVLLSVLGIGYIRYVLPCGFALFLLVAVAKGIVFFIRYAPEKECTSLHRLLAERNRELAEMSAREMRLIGLIKSQDEQLRAIEQTHQAELAKVRMNGGNTGLFHGYTGSDASRSVSAIETKRQPPPLPRRDRPPVPRRPAFSS